MESLLAKALERLGRKKIWLIVHVLQALSAENSTTDGVREALRNIGLYVDDDVFSKLTAQFAPNGSSNFDTAAFMRALAATLPPRRQYVVGLVLRRLDPEESGFVSFDTLRALYNVLRHPQALVLPDTKALVEGFFANFNENRRYDSTGLTTDELIAYYVGISLTTPRDEDFELRCIRSFSLDRPLVSFNEESTKHLEHRRSLKALAHGVTAHPLYQTTSMDYGKDCDKLLLTRGPETLQRRISLQIPLDGTAVTVGRGLENNIVLDAGLLFASRQHCELFVRRTKDTEVDETETADAEEKEKWEKKDASDCDGRRWAEGRTSTALELCLVDVGSSNGTFVNGVRVVANVATPLRHCDEVVFGGMRDVAAGESFPEDAVTNAPEIVTWRVVFDASDDGVDFGYVATSQVVLSAEYLEAEEKRMTLQLLQHLEATTTTAAEATTTTATRTSAEATPSRMSCEVTSAVTPPPTVLKRARRPRSLRGEEEMENSPQALMARGEPQHGRKSGDGKSRNSQRRSGTVAAQLVPQAEGPATSPLATVALRALRAGTRSFAAFNGRRRGSRWAGGSQQQPPHTLTITETEWRWAIENKASGKRRHLVEGVLPWFFVERIVYCAPQRGLIVQLLPDCAHFLHLAEETNFVSWLVDEETDEGEENKPGTALSSFKQLLDSVGRVCAVTKACPQPQPIDEAEFFAHYAPKLVE